MDFGPLRHRVTLDNPSTSVPDGSGASTVLWPPDGGVRLGTRVAASVQPAADTGTLEHEAAKTNESVGTYTVRVRYLPGVSTQTRVTFHDGPTDRTLWVTGVTDEAFRHAALTLTCREVQA
jgi:head-tail adaptor